MTDLDKKFATVYLLAIRADGAHIATGMCTAKMYERIHDALVRNVPFLRLSDDSGGGHDVTVRSSSVTAVVLGDERKCDGDLSLFDGLNGVTYTDYADDSTDQD